MRPKLLLLDEVMAGLNAGEVDEVIERIKSCFGLAHRSGKWTVAEIYRRTLDGIPFFVDNEAEAPVLMKEGQPIASSVLINSTLGENRDSFLRASGTERERARH